MSKLILRYCPLVGCIFAAFCRRFLGSEGSAIIILTLFILLLILIIVYRIRLSKRKKSLLFLILFLVFFFCSLFRLHLLECFNFALPFFLWGVSSGEIIPGSGPSRSSSWAEDPFEIQVLTEPFSETEMEGTSARSSIPRVAIDEAGPSHQGHEEAEPPQKVVNNASLESSMRNRIVRLEQDNSPYLLDKAKGEYWTQIKQQLDHIHSQDEYNRFIEFENRDLQIRERKQECLRLFNHVLAKHPPLEGLAPYNPQEALNDFLDEHRQEVDKRVHLEVEKGDREHIAFLEKLLSDLKNSGPDAVKRIFYPPSPSNN